MFSGFLNRIKAFRPLFVLSIYCLAGVSLSLAQEATLSPEERAVIIQYTWQARFGSGLKAGDWVKYQYGDSLANSQEIELRAAEGQDGAIWIVETVLDQAKGGQISTHLLVNPAGQTISEIFILDGSGEKESLPVLPIEQFYTKLSELLTKFSEQGAVPPFGWRKGEEQRQVQTKAGSFACSCLEPDLDEEEKDNDELSDVLKDKAKSSLGLKSLKSLVEKPEDLGEVLDLADRVETVTSVEGLKGMLETPDIDDLDEIINLIANRKTSQQQETKSPLLCSLDVPRMIPYNIAIRFFFFPDVLKQVEGGLVKIGSLELVSFSGQ